MGEWPVIGSIIECVDDRGKVTGCNSLLKKGKFYTVTAVENTGWIKGVRLLEAPTKGVAPFSISRFKPVLTII